MNDALTIEAQDLQGFWHKFRSMGYFDPKSFSQLVEDTGEETTLKILARFTETLKEAEQQVVAARATEDSDPIWRACHKVAGSANLIGFTQYGTYSKDLSHQIRANPEYSDYEAEIESFLGQTRELLAEIKSAITNLNDHL